MYKLDAHFNVICHKNVSARPCVFLVFVAEGEEITPPTVAIIGLGTVGLGGLQPPKFFIYKAAYS